MDFAEKGLITNPLMIFQQGSWSNPIKQSLHWWPNLIFGTFSSWSKSKNWQVVAGRWSVQFSFSASFSGKEGSLEKIVAKCCHGPVATSGSQLVTAKKETATFSTSAEVHSHITESALCYSLRLLNNSILPLTSPLQVRPLANLFRRPTFLKSVQFRYLSFSP